MILYLSFLYLAFIISSYVIKEYDIHLGLWAGIAFGSLVSLIFGYIVLSLAIRITSSDTE